MPLDMDYALDFNGGSVYTDDCCFFVASRL